MKDEFGSHESDPDSNHGFHHRGTETQRHREIGIHQNGSGSVSLCLCGEIRGSDHFVTVARNDSKAYIASCPLGLSP